MKSINYATFNLKDLDFKRNVGIVFEKNPPVRKFRDTLTIYKDGKVLFVRYCYGESAGEVARMWNNGSIGINGEFNWNYDACQYTKKEEAPVKLSGFDADGAIYCDDQIYSWSRKKELKTDNANGYTIFNRLFSK